MSIFYAYPEELAAARAFGLVYTAVASAIPVIESIVFRHTPHVSGSAGAGMDIDDNYYFESPCATPDTIMGGVPTKRPATPIETPMPKRVYESPDPRDYPVGGRGLKYTDPSYTVGFCRDFSGVQRTRLNPVTGRIIGYKGIPRKRALSPTSKYSQFWRDQKYAKTSFHAARSPGIWDSARR